MIPKKIKELVETEIESHRQSIAELERYLESDGQSTRILDAIAGNATKVPKKRRMSAEARAKLSRQVKKAWKKRKAQAEAVKLAKATQTGPVAVEEPVGAGVGSDD